MKIPFTPTLILSSILAASTAHGDTVGDLLAEYTADAAGPFSASAGETLWQRPYVSANGAERACMDCHTKDVRQRGQHAVTGKPIEPLAPSVNPERLTKRPEIEKWFKRNCKWTIGRQCTAQEKGDLLSFLRNQ